MTARRSDVSRQIGQVFILLTLRLSLFLLAFAFAFAFAFACAYACGVRVCASGAWGGCVRGW